jgi:hypothetical protein
MAWNENPEHFFLQLPLYAPLAWQPLEVFSVVELLYYRGIIDCYCLGCKRDSTFRGQNAAIPKELSKITFETAQKLHAATGLPRNPGQIIRPPKPPLIPAEIFLVSFDCGRDHTHTMQFLFLIKNESGKAEEGQEASIQNIQKIGQFPSLAALNLPQIHKYRPILSEKYEDFSRGVGLAAHDVGIGAYVYLRRVFEHLVEEAHQLATSSDKWDDSEYLSLRMNERVQALKDHLPKFLVDHPEMYGILSKGLHELSEKECLEHFSAIKVGIELILDEKIEQKAREKKLKEASKAIKTAAK